MTMWTGIVLIVLLGVVGEAWRNHCKARNAGSSKEALDHLNQRIDEVDSELRQRVETLERIVTDNQDDLKRQFDHLDKVG